MFRAGGRVRDRDRQVCRAGGRVRRGTDRCVEQGAG